MQKSDPLTWYQPRMILNMSSSGPTLPSADHTNEVDRRISYAVLWGLSNKVPILNLNLKSSDLMPATTTFWIAITVSMSFQVHFLQLEYQIKDYGNFSWSSENAAKINIILNWLPMLQVTEHFDHSDQFDHAFSSLIRVKLSPRHDSDLQ